MSYESSSYSDPEYYAVKWIPWYTQLWGHFLFVEVDEDFIKDAFNLFGLRAKFPRYDDAIATILGPAPTRGEFNSSEFRTLYTQATDLYGLIHARYIITPKGLSKMRRKYNAGLFGSCPRIRCNKIWTLPVGITDELRQHRVRLYCPSCQEIYLPLRSQSAYRSEHHGSADSAAESEAEHSPQRLADVDGAYFGPSFPHIFLLQFPSLIPRTLPVPHVPKIFGFKVRGQKSVVQIKIENGEYGKISGQ